MSHDKLLLDKLADVLRAVRPVERQEYFLLLPDWKLRLHAEDCRVQEHPCGCMVQGSLVACHPYLPGGFVRELLVGVGSDLNDAVGRGILGWCLLVLPTLKFIFEDDPHDCLVNVEDILLPNASQAECRLIEGPVQPMGFSDPGPTEAIQSRLVNTFRDQLLPALGDGVHHLRCFACKTAEGASADVFLNGTEWAEGSKRLQEHASGFPEPDEANPIYSLKQHLLVRPVDLPAGLSEEMRRQLDQWQKAVAAPAESSVREALPAVLRATYLIGRRHAFSEREYEDVLKADGMSATLADQLAAFLPSAAAWVLMKGKVRFCEEYLWTNSLTNRAVRRRYDQTPVFMAALHAYAELARQGMASQEISTVARTSAEMNGISQALAKGTNLDGARITLMIVHTREPVDGEDLNVLLGRSRSVAQPPRKAGKLWWKFW